MYRFCNKSVKSNKRKIHFQMISDRISIAFHDYIFNVYERLIVDTRLFFFSRFNGHSNECI